MIADASCSKGKVRQQVALTLLATLRTIPRPWQSPWRGGEPAPRHKIKLQRFTHERLPMQPPDLAIIVTS